MSDATASVQHPAPERHRVGWLRQLLALFGAATVWAGQVSLSEILSSHACYPHAAPLNAPLWDWLHAALAAVSALSFLAAAACAALAWTSWQRTRHEARADKPYAVAHNEGRTRFLAMLGAWVSLLFFIATMFTACAIVLVPPCRFF